MELFGHMNGVVMERETVIGFKLLFSEAYDIFLFNTF